MRYLSKLASGGYILAVVLAGWIELAIYRISFDDAALNLTCIGVLASLAAGIWLASRKLSRSVDEPHR